MIERHPFLGEWYSKGPAPAPLLLSTSSSSNITSSSGSSSLVSSLFNSSTTNIEGFSPKLGLFTV